METSELSKDILKQLMLDVEEPNAAAPDTIAEDIYEMILDECGHELADKIADGVFELMSALVADVGKYR